MPQFGPKRYSTLSVPFWRFFLKILGKKRRFLGGREALCSGKCFQKIIWNLGLLLQLKDGEIG